MLEAERHHLILQLLSQNQTVRLHEIASETGASESTIRRDLIELENQKKLKRIHGGAAKLQGKLQEATMSEKTSKNLHSKQQIGQAGASCVESGDTIYLDAGSTAFEMIAYLPPSIIVVTNGISHTDALLEQGCKTILTGGIAKPSTKALVGRGALSSLQQYRFDKCFLGVNGIHPEYGCTTPDEEEAQLKELAIHLSRESYLLADHSKFQEVAFARFADCTQTTIVTTSESSESMHMFPKETRWKVVQL
ncbi:DeoR/GlpR family DNA-binding transcription regulator [Sporosarcina aquimarina]|uniref:DeoR/GlpR family DNA-binding transcription regulator n=1 Tax=Sporosarcina aquimarina TaxID=114975 RepID=A0ABU4G0Y9_9BACL|nr:DeoR/GlpR family DNA-binding transcription regulator [Sporosarcina aquimarina]MDW0110630.1 DeoR/GlpR family DNA-binding transcription regulator [Sporosarcina aquimarina]